MIDQVKKQLSIEFIWIPAKFGGHSASPYIGMRLSIRWQKHIKESLNFGRDIECILLDYAPDLMQGLATFSYVSDIPNEWLNDGEPIEILNGIRVLGVGQLRP